MAYDLEADIAKYAAENARTKRMLIGMRVRFLGDFPGTPLGTMGTIKSFETDQPGWTMLVRTDEGNICSWARSWWEDVNDPASTEKPSHDAEESFLQRRRERMAYWHEREASVHAD